MIKRNYILQEYLLASTCQYSFMIVIWFLSPSGQGISERLRRQNLVENAGRFILHAHLNASL